MLEDLISVGSRVQQAWLIELSSSYAVRGLFESTDKGCAGWQPSIAFDRGGASRGPAVLSRGFRAVRSLPLSLSLSKCQCDALHCPACAGLKGCSTMGALTNTAALAILTVAVFKSNKVLARLSYNLQTLVAVNHCHPIPASPGNNNNNEKSHFDHCAQLALPKNREA
ncbi:hypothetical protein LZ32DRAFT_270760 [Colletotrichum eremochloae]|nr:hypothetical protein LZ32DRAFT_270760 [Colletotrichum eremochloae]